MHETKFRWLCLAQAILLLSLRCHNASAEQARFKISDSLRDRCLSVLQSGMRGEEFWPAIHAAEGLTLSGCGNEVIRFLKPKLADETDDQHRCGLARELVRAGHRASGKVMLDIAAGDDEVRRLCHQPGDRRVRRERERGFGGRAREHDRARVGPREDLALDAPAVAPPRAHHRALLGRLHLRGAMTAAGSVSRRRRAVGGEGRSTGQSRHVHTSVATSDKCW